MKWSLFSSSRRRAAFAALALAACLTALPQSGARAAERTLAGVRIFSPVSVILKQFGDPTFITPGTSYASFTYTPGQPLVTPPADSSNSAAGQTASVSMSPQGMMGGGPGMMGPGAMGGPGMTGAPGAPGTTAGATDEFNILYPSASRYYYTFPAKGLTYEFVVSSDGRVIAIKAIGYRGTIRTNKGVMLGNTYAQVLAKYGYPESTTSQSDAVGTILTLSYLQRDHVVFRIARNIVSVISVSAPD